MPDHSTIRKRDFLVHFPALEIWVRRFDLVVKLVTNMHGPVLPFLLGHQPLKVALVAGEVQVMPVREKTAWLPGAWLAGFLLE